MTATAPGLPGLLRFFRQRMNCAVTFQTPVDVSDGQGGVTRTWANLATDVAAIQALSGAERLAEASPGVSVTHRIFLGYRSDLSPIMRVAYGARTFDIHTVIDYAEQHLLTELLCEERFRK